MPAFLKFKRVDCPFWNGRRIPRLSNGTPCHCGIVGNMATANQVQEEQEEDMLRQLYRA